MTQPEGTPAAIAPSAVEPAGASQVAPASLPDSDEAATLKTRIAELEEQFGKLKSVKDSETASERRARLEAEAERERLLAELQAEREAHWRNFTKYAPEDEVGKAKQLYEQERAARSEAETNRARWEAWKWQTLSDAGVPADKIKAARNQQQVTMLLQEARDSKVLADKEAELEARILARLKKEGVIAPSTPAPKTPIDAGAAPADKPKLTLADVEKAEREYARNPRNMKAREIYLKAVADFSGDPKPEE